MRTALVLVVFAACGSAPPPAATTTEALAPAPAPAPRTPLAQLEASRDLDHALVGRAKGPTVVMLLASWCGRCRDEIAVFDHVRIHVPHVRWLGMSFKPHEEYDQRGNAEAVRELADATPWLRIVPADETLFAAFGSPPKVPTIFVYDSRGTLVATFDRRERDAPDETELEALLRSLP